MKKFIKIITAMVISVIFSTNASAIEVIPSGECVGVKFFTDGLIVTDTSEITDTNGGKRNFAKENDIQKGDIIAKINGRHAVSNEMLTCEIANTNEPITLTIKRGDDERDISITPIETNNGKKLGLWLRDSTAGLGTITCYYGKKFAALGHGIFDIDTGKLMAVGRGIIQSCEITNLTRGSSGNPGAVTGNIEGDFLGSITANTENGLFGNTAFLSTAAAIEVANPEEIKCGNAFILSDIDGKGPREYKIEIKKISPVMSGKDMIIKITDDILLDKTGGIVQGMSGAPIIQGNKLIGAITHVFVNDPSQGYAIFAERMLKEF